MLPTRVIAFIRDIEMYLPPISHLTCHNSELQLGHQVYNVFRLTVLTLFHFVSRMLIED